MEFLTPPRRATTCPGLAQEESQPRILLRDLDFFQVDMLGIKESFYVLPVAPATGEDSATIVNSARNKYENYASSQDLREKFGRAVTMGDKYVEPRNLS